MSLSRGGEDHDVYGYACPHTRDVSFKGGFASEFRRWFDGMDDLAKNLNIRIHEIYSCRPEHIFYFILDAGDFKDVAAFFSGIMLTNHTGRILSCHFSQGSD